MDVKLALLTATSLVLQAAAQCRVCSGGCWTRPGRSGVVRRKDKALLYFRLLRRDVNVAQRGYREGTPAPSRALAEDNCAVMDRSSMRPNALAVVYGETPDQFVDQAHRARDKPDADEEPSFQAMQRRFKRCTCGAGRGQLRLVGLGGRRAARATFTTAGGERRVGHGRPVSSRWWPSGTGRARCAWVP